MAALGPACLASPFRLRRGACHHTRPPSPRAVSCSTANCGRHFFRSVSPSCRTVPPPPCAQTSAAAAAPGSAPTAHGLRC
eukprot:scaffold33961_cov61-Phaeocystis_antarctica.AAC.1